jgi:type I restriction enzyme S subunit
MSEWFEVSLGDLFSVKHGFAFKGEFFCTHETKELLVTPGNFSRSGGFQNNKPKYYNGPIPENYILTPGELVITMTDLSKEADTLGFAALIPKDSNIWLHNQRVGLVRLHDSTNCDLRFLSFLLRSRDYRSWVIGSATGTTVKHTSPRKIETFSTKIPPLPEQKAIAHILGTLDDKIELNRRQNETLEAMAQALFKSWFVDFDPVLDIALAAGNTIPPALQKKAAQRQAVADEKKLSAKNPALAQLFPASFEFNEELRKWVPEGWTVKSLDDVATIIGGGTPSTKVYEYFCKNGIPWLSPKDLSGYNWKYISRGATDITSFGLQKSSAKLMPKGSVLFSSRAPIGYIAIAENEISTNQGFKSLVPNKGVATEYLYQLLKSNADKIESVATGSTFKEVSGAALKGINVLVPSTVILERHSEIISASNEMSLRNQKQTATLTKLRDTLLPRLISGKLRLSSKAIIGVNETID